MAKSKHCGAVAGQRCELAGNVDVGGQLNVVIARQRSPFSYDSIRTLLARGFVQVPLRFATEQG